LKTDWFKIITVVVILGLVAEVVLLIKQNRELQQSLRDRIDPYAQSLKPGDRVAPCSFTGLDGSARDLRFSGTPKRQLLFVMSTSCSHCEHDLPFWNHIAEENTENSCGILGVSIDGMEETKKYRAAADIKFDLVVTGDKHFETDNKISGVPQTILLGEDGVVKRIWLGELNMTMAQEIQNELKTPKSSTN
jgi:peroxiredoxin